MNRKKTKYMLAAVGALVLSVPSAFAEMRDWTSKDGKKLQAEFVGTQGAGNTAEVKLKLANGTIVNYPVSKLSELDRVFVKSSLPSDPAALAAEIDKLVLNKLRESYYGLRDDLAELAANKDLDNADKAKRKEEIEREMEMCKPNPLTTDEQFMRRIYLDIAGRIPTYNEAAHFLDSNDRNKRAALIDELLDTEAFAMRMYNFFSDLLRVREGVMMMANGDLKVDPYIEWIKQCMKDDKPFDQMVRDMMTAEGHIWDNPATGYIISDAGMRLCNVSNTFTIFLGTEITCAQCHDHPFEQVKQIDFYRMASFMGTTETRAGRGGMRMMDGPSDRQELARMSKILKDAGKLRMNDTIDRTIQDVMNSRRTLVNDTQNQKVALPHDYKYDNGEPNQKLRPAAYFGDTVNLEKHENPRAAFAEWLTSPGNPRFTVNIVNRLWKMAFGLGQIEPVYNIPGHLDGQAQNYELLSFLEALMQDVDFSIKDFLRVVYNTKTYQSEAETMTPSLTQVDNGTYHFPGPILRRMSAEQLWDSLVTLTTDNPEGMVRRGWEEYRELMHTDTTKLTTLAQIEAYKNKFRNIGRGLSNGEEMMMDRNAGRVGGETMVRASEMAQPQRPGHFLRMFGQSDKNLIENQFTAGSSPQVMALLNGTITNQVLSSPDAYLIKEVIYGPGRKGDKVDKIFLSVLGRMPTPDEARKASSGMRPSRSRNMSDRDRQAMEVKAIGDVVWALVNTREFMFIQ
ncbi:MAG: DUF1549 domain-containing protein [Verrucomicrobiales bacterium]|nr:DUF1549 domain-containing protein [Verrucomicrobiales bacterium]